MVSNIEALSEHHHVVALDLMGAGRTDKPAVSYSAANLARFLNNFLETQGVQRASLIGSSLGGAVSLQFAIRYREKLDKLVLVSSAGLGREVALALRLSTLPLVGEMLSRPSRKGTARLLKLYVRDPAIITAEILDMSFALISLPGAHKAWLSTLRDNATLRGQRVDLLRFVLDNFRSITAPTLVVWGREDAIFPLAHAYVAERGIPNARLAVFDSCGHLPMLECAAAFNAVVSEFLRKDQTP